MRESLHFNTKNISLAIPVAGNMRVDFYFNADKISCKDPAGILCGVLLSGVLPADPDRIFAKMPHQEIRRLPY